MAQDASRHGRHHRRTTPRGRVLSGPAAAAVVLACGALPAAIAAPAAQDDPARVEPAESRPAASASADPTANPAPSAEPTAEPSADPSEGPSTSTVPSTSPVPSPTPVPSATAVPTVTPSPEPSSPEPTSPEPSSPAPTDPGPSESAQPTPSPSASPSESPSPEPSSPEPTQPEPSEPAPSPGGPGSGGSGSAPSPGTPADPAPPSTGGNTGESGTGGAASASPGSGQSGPEERRRAPFAASDQQPSAPLSRDSSQRRNFSGVSSWVEHYLGSHRQEGSQRRDDSQPVDSNANAGVADVEGAAGDVTQEQGQASSRADRAFLDGPLPLLIFSAAALGSFALVLLRAAKAWHRDADQS